MTADPAAIFTATDGWAAFQRGDLLGRDGRYRWPCAAETGPTDCPVCGQQWPNPPDVKLFEDVGFVWVEGKAVRLTRDNSQRVLTALIEHFGRFLPRRRLVELGWSDRPDVDAPDREQIPQIVRHLREVLAPTAVTVQGDQNLGYRLVRKEEAAEYERRKATQREIDADLEAAARISEKRTRARDEFATADGRRDRRARIGNRRPGGGSGARGASRTERALRPS